MPLRASWKTLGVSDTGTEFVDSCLDLHARGEWGAADPATQRLNERDASDSALAMGGTVVGIYPIPPEVQVDGLPGDRLVIGTLAGTDRERPRQRGCDGDAAGV